MENFFDPDTLSNLSKNDFYAQLNRAIAPVLEGEDNLIARMATLAAILGKTKKYLWAGFYIVEGDELVLGPFCGPLACFRIKKGRGVCGTAWACEESILVANVNEFAGHIACSSLSNSEIVIPIREAHGSAILGVLDVDHREIGGLDEMDLRGLEKLVELVFSAPSHATKNA